MLMIVQGDYGILLAGGAAGDFMTMSLAERAAVTETAVRHLDGGTAIAPSEHTQLGRSVHIPSTIVPNLPDGDALLNLQVKAATVDGVRQVRVMPLQTSAIGTHSSVSTHDHDLQARLEEGS